MFKKGTVAWPRWFLPNGGKPSPAREKVIVMPQTPPKSPPKSAAKSAAKSAGQTPAPAPEGSPERTVGDGVPLSLPYRTAALSDRKPTRFRLTPDAATRAAMAAALDVLAVNHFQFEGEITPSGRHDYRLTGEMQARVVQACIVTLAPVPVTLHETVQRRYSADALEPDAEEVEMLDETLDPLPEVLDVGEVALEALALALPLYPRAPGAALAETVFAAPGNAPLTDADLKPFAGLAGLKDRLAAARPPEDGTDSGTEDGTGNG